MKSLKLKGMLPYLPEALLFTAITISFLGELIETSSANFFMIGCGAILWILVIWKNRYFALCLAVILGLVSCYMLFAVFSEYKKFPSGDTDGLTLLFIGGLIFTSLLVISFFLPKKYFDINKGV
jgi:hypothetical protein